MTSFGQRFERNDAVCHIDNVSRGRNVPDRWKSKHVLMLGVFGDEEWGNTEAHRLLDHLKP